MMPLFTKAHYWSSDKSCRRKSHSCSLILLLLSNPLLHCSRSKPPSRRHFFHQLFRGVAEGAESSTAPRHQGSFSHSELHSLTLGHQWDRTAVLALSQQESLFGSLEKWSQTYLKMKRRLWRHYYLQISAEEKLPSTHLHRDAPGTEQKSQFCISNGEARNPFPACYWYPVQWQGNQESENISRLWITSDNQKVALLAPSFST